MSRLRFLSTPTQAVAQLAANLERSGIAQRGADRGYDLLAFHTTGRDFPAFRRRLSDIGMHFGDEGQGWDLAQWRTARHGGLDDNYQTMPVLLRARSPLRLDHDPGLFNIENLPYALPAQVRGRWQSWRYGGGAGAPMFGVDVHPNRQLALLRNWLERAGYDSLLYRNTSETSAHVHDALFAARKLAREAWELVKERQKARGRPLNVFDQTDQAMPEYRLWSDAEADVRQIAQGGYADSIAVFRPQQIKSIFAREFDPRSRELLRALALLLAGAGAAREQRA